MMIKRAVLLHQYHNVFDVVNGTGAAVRGNGKRFGDVRAERACRRTHPHSHHLDELTTIHIAHVRLPERAVWNPCETPRVIPSPGGEHVSDMRLQTDETCVTSS